MYGQPRPKEESERILLEADPHHQPGWVPGAAELLLSVAAPRALGGRPQPQGQATGHASFSPIPTPPLLCHQWPPAPCRSRQNRPHSVAWGLGRRLTGCLRWMHLRPGFLRRPAHSPDSGSRPLGCFWGPGSTPGFRASAWWGARCPWSSVSSGDSGPRHEWRGPQAGGRARVMGQGIRPQATAHEGFS